MKTIQMPAKFVDLVNSIAKREGVTPTELFRRAFPAEGSAITIPLPESAKDFYQAEADRLEVSVGAVARCVLAEHASKGRALRVVEATESVETVCVEMDARKACRIEGLALATGIDARTILEDFVFGMLQQFEGSAEECVGWFAEWFALEQKEAPKGCEQQLLALWRRWRREGNSTRPKITAGSVFAPASDATGIDPKLTRRFREVEVAADLERGSVLSTILEVFEPYSESPVCLEGFVFDGWNVSEKGEVRKALRALWRRWQKEDAPERARADKEHAEAVAKETPVERERLIEKIKEDDRKERQHCREMERKRGFATVVLDLDAKLVDAAEAHFAGTEYGSFTGFLKTELPRVAADFATKRGHKIKGLNA